MNNHPNITFNISTDACINTLKKEGSLNNILHGTMTVLFICV